MDRPVFHSLEPLHLQVEQAILRALATGELPVGSRLPSTAEWAREWEINPLHLQRALKRLALLGYLDRKPRAGTFVRPERRKRRVAVLTAYPVEEERFHALRQVFQLLEQSFPQEGLQLHFFNDLLRLFASEREGTGPAEEMAATIRVLQPVALVEVGFDSLRYPSMQWAYELPKMRMGAPARGGELFLDVARFYQEALAYLSRRGVRRVALIGRESSAYALPKAHEMARAHQIAISQTILIEDREPLSPLDGLALRQMQVAFPAWAMLPLEKRPEALLVVDDILMRGVARAWEGTVRDNRWHPLPVVLGSKGIRHRYGLTVVRVEVDLQSIADSILQLTLARLLGKPAPSLPIGVPCTVTGG